MPYSCPHPVCNTSLRSFESLVSLSIHWRRKHQDTAEALWLALHGNIKPTCKCGCHGALKFMGIEQGYTEWIRGHVSRVKNNWGHNDAAREKSLDTRRSMFERGELSTWNDGLTKETDKRVAAYGEVQSANFTPERKAACGQTMTNSWATGAITPLTGSAHPQWAGGVSAVHGLCRSHLFRPWVYPKLVAAKFMCSRCGVSKDLHVHHDDVRFSTILRGVVAALGEPGEDFAKKAAIAEAVTQYHLDRDVSGVVLCEECHKLAHATSE